MRYSDEGQYRNGYPSWPQLLEALDRWGMRIHQRIDDTQEGLHEKINEVRVEVTTIKATLAANQQARPGRAARLKEWAELIAPLRELVLALAFASAGLAALTQAPTIRAGLADLAAIARQGAE